MKNHHNWSARNKQAIIIRSTLTAVALLTYFTKPLLLTIIIAAYATWQTYTMARHGFRCRICWLEFVKAIPLLLLSLFSFHFILHLLAIVLIWQDSLLEPTKK